MKKYLFLAVFPVLVFLFYFFRSFYNCQNISCIDLKGLNGYREEEIYVDENGIYRALFIKNNDKLKIEVYSNLEEKEFLTIKDEAVAITESFYQKSAAPYPGEISDSVTCDANRVPKIKSVTGINTQVFYFSSKLNDRFVYSCTQEEDSFNGMTLLFYCQNQKKGYILEFINELSEPEMNITSIINTVKCL